MCNSKKYIVLSVIQLDICDIHVTYQSPKSANKLCSKYYFLVVTSLNSLLPSFMPFLAQTSWVGGMGGCAYFFLKKLKNLYSRHQSA